MLYHGNKMRFVKLKVQWVKWALFTACEQQQQQIVTIMQAFMQLLRKCPTPEEALRSTDLQLHELNRRRSMVEARMRYVQFQASKMQPSKSQQGRIKHLMLQQQTHAKDLEAVDQDITILMQTQAKIRKAISVKQRADTMRQTTDAIRSVELPSEYDLRTLMDEYHDVADNVDHTADAMEADQRLEQEASSDGVGEITAEDIAFFMLESKNAFPAGPSVSSTSTSVTPVLIAAPRGVEDMRVRVHDDVPLLPSVPAARPTTAVAQPNVMAQLMSSDVW